MNAVIVGRGWVGTKLSQVMGIPMVSHHEIFQALRYDTLINCAGLTGIPNVDACENQKTETILANTVLPIKLYHMCDEQGKTFVHFGSGCIYQGGPWRDIDKPNYEASIYSASKRAADEYLNGRCLVLRVRMPFCGERHPKNLLTKLANYAETGKLLDGINSLSDIDEMVGHAANLINDRKVGPYNLVNRDAISTRAIAALMGLHARWFAPNEFKNPRSECRLIPSVETRPVRDALEKAIECLNS
jgi:dTDP-4-dehydrorhamnose reductase